MALKLTKKGKEYWISFTGEDLIFVLPPEILDLVDQAKMEGEDLSDVDEALDKNQVYTFKCEDITL